MKIYFCVYSNQVFLKPRKALINLAKKSRIFEDIFEYDREWLEKTDFFEKNSDVLCDNSKGDGWCLWKPYIILESLKKIHDGEIIFYMDSSDTFLPTLGSFLRKHFSSNDVLLCQMGESPNRNYTRRDTFYYMRCDSKKYWNTIQLEAGIIGIKKNNYTIKLMEEYLKFCSDPRIIKGGTNLCGLPNFPTFIDHRYDQSVLTNLKTKYGILPSLEIKNHVECNMWEALKHEGENGITEFLRKLSSIQYRCGSYFEIWNQNYLSELFKI